MKFFDKIQVSTVDHSGGVLINNGVFAGLAQGTGEQDRIGRKIICKSLFLRGHIRLLDHSGATFPDYNMIRIMVIEDRQCNGANATTAEIFETPPIGPDLISSFNNLANKNRFKTHLDKFVPLNYTTLSGTTNLYASGKLIPFKFFKKLNIPVEFSGTGTSTISNIQSSNLFVFLWTVTADLNVQFDCISRVRFVG